MGRALPGQRPSAGVRGAVLGPARLAPRAGRGRSPGARADGAPLRVRPPLGRAPERPPLRRRGGLLRRGGARAEGAPVNAPSPLLQWTAFSSLYFASLAVAAAAARRAFRRPAPGGRAPGSAAVVVACKGGGPELEANVRAMTEQDFPGRLEFVFVVPRADDPARARLERVLAGVSRPWRVVVSDAQPRETTELVLNFLHGAACAGPDTEALVFAPCDIRPPRGWVAALCAELADPEVGAATAGVVCVPSGPLVPAALKTLWNGVACALHALAPTVSGQSFALRRADFDAWEVGRAWSVSLVEDLVTDRVVKARGRRVALAARATPASADPAGWADLFRGFTRWLFYGRIYTPRHWALGAFLALMKPAAMAWMAWFPNLRPVLAAFLALDALAAWALLRAQAGPLEGQAPELGRRYARLSAAAVVL
ncbi:glycosyltransferase family 2 protein, partial [bacterium]